MIEQLKSLEEYLIANKMQDTLRSLRAEILNKYPQAPSNQFNAIFQEEESKEYNKAKQSDRKVRKSIQLTQHSFSKKNKIQDKIKSEDIVQGLIGKIAYSSNMLFHKSTKSKIQKLLNNKIFKNCVYKMFPPCEIEIENILQIKNKNKIEHIESQLQFRDQLDLIQVQVNFKSQNSNSQNFYQNSQNQNYISQIQIDQQDQSIISQPGMLLQQLAKIDIQDQYFNDSDPGYHQFLFQQSQLMLGCSKITIKYGYPQIAVLSNSKHEPKISPKVIKQQQKNNFSKFPPAINFPASNDKIYPLEYDGIVYDVLKLKVIFDRQKTGYEETSELQIRQGDILAGRFRIDSVLGSGVFAKVLKVYDTIKNQSTCLKMVSNNKDFFDQALDEIKILRYINANCHPDQHNLLKFKNVFYHRQHLLIQTDLLKDNLFVAYRKNPAYFSIPVLKQIGKQILIALKMLHSLHIIHADLKPQNILIKSYEPIKIKVVDLGNSCFFHDRLGEYVQSRSYRAPEVVLGSGYDAKIDIWSLGCILAELWTKNILFYNTNIQGMLARMQSIAGPWPQWMLDKGTAVENYFSKENVIFFQEDNKFHILIPKKTSLKARIRSNDQFFLSFLEDTLQIDPHIRLSAEQALNHQFFII